MHYVFLFGETSLTEYGYDIVQLFILKQNAHQILLCHRFCVNLGVLHVKLYF